MLFMNNWKNPVSSKARCSVVNAKNVIFQEMSSYASSPAGGRGGDILLEIERNVLALYSKI